MRGSIAERGSVRMGHRIIEINGESVVATSHQHIVELLATTVGEVCWRYGVLFVKALFYWVPWNQVLNFKTIRISNWFVSLQIRIRIRKTMPASMYRLLVGLETPQHIWSDREEDLMLKITTGPLEEVRRQSRNESDYVTLWEKLCHAVCPWT